MTDSIETSGPMGAAEPSAGGREVKFELMPSRQFPNWLAELRMSRAITTTYQAGKLFLVGLRPNGRLNGSSSSASGSAPMATGSG